MVQVVLPRRGRPNGAKIHLLVSFTMIRRPIRIHASYQYAISQPRVNMRIYSEQMIVGEDS